MTVAFLQTDVQRCGLCTVS